MFYTVYKITNQITDMIYIGKHKTSNLDDGYLGSGLLIRRAINKYGVENFHKEILHVFDNEADMNAKEAELVTEEFVLQETNYNLCVGGKGGWDPVKAKTAFLGKQHTQEAKEKIGIATASRIPWNKGKSIGPMPDIERMKRSVSLKGRAKSEEYKQNHSNIMKEYYALNPNEGGWPKGKPKPTITCPHCGKEGSPNNMKRWHFDNCKINAARSSNGRKTGSEPANLGSSPSRASNP